MRKRVGFILVALVIVYLIASVAVFPRMALSVNARPADGSPADVDVGFENIKFESDGLTLSGWWMPAPEQRAVLVYSHGAGANRHSDFFNSLDFYRAMTALGVSVLTFDHRNHGVSASDTGMLAMGRSEWRDIAAAVRWLESRGLGQLPRVITGNSMGGASAIYAAANGVHADAWVLFDPALDNFDTLSSGGWVRYGLPSALFYPFAAATIAFYDIAGDDDNALATARSLAVPILIFQDEDDPITRAPFAHALAAENPNIELLSVPAIDPNDACVSFKGRWGTHVAAYHCHPEWTMAEMRRFLQAQGVLAPLAQPSNQ